jgi:hypothetical protein
MLRICIPLLAALACNGTIDVEDDPGGNGQPATGFRLEEVVSGLQRPVHLTAPAGDARLFIVEQPGRIRIVENGQLRAEPFLDIVSRVRSQGNEQGLLGLAFHPGYGTNGYFYVNYTDTEGDTRVERYRVSADRNRADAASATLIIGYDQPYGNHNGGHLLFGPDGMLYIPTGDGGSGGDPQGHGQNRSSLLGKILRLDVDGGNPYAIPADNPFRDQAGVRPEIWATGLRNPWRIAFDAQDGLLYVADVGQNTYEEISVVPADEGGINFGWNTMEASHCFRPQTGCDQSGLTRPLVEYPRSDGISVTGGVVYRGEAIPELKGHYLYADFGRQWIRAFRYQNGQATDARTLEIEVPSVSSFGVDGAGEMYIVSLGGRVVKVVPDA